MKIKRAFLDTEDGQIHYRIGGEGKPLLLLHRNPSSSNEFQDLMPIFAETKRVIAMDLMGLGDSDKPPRIYSVADYAKTGIMLLDELGIKTTSILGHHTGAYVGAEVAAAYPDRVDKLILCNVDDFTEEQKAAIANRYYQVFQIKPDGSHLVERWSFRAQYVGSTELNHLCMLDEAKCYGYPPYAPLAFINYPYLERFRLIQCPTLVLSGTEDIKGLVKLGLAQAENRNFIKQVIPQAKVIDIEGGTFCMMHQQTQEISRVVLEFLDVL
ncbi:alpha/beta fold hydrolase [Fischerella sp. PCC 9605]|uniref:alpha/beta fold hydrolase n=1 Tax=Fischerella sp. PCC 9605 TaxID=1173024 RepID=UPI00047A6834|nr:alpha/beta hydrolase [Fischerella sp. PCC 9605]